MPAKLSCWECGRVWGKVNPGLFSLEVDSEIECLHPENLQPVPDPMVWARWI